VTSLLLSLVVVAIISCLLRCGNHSTHPHGSSNLDGAPSPPWELLPLCYKSKLSLHPLVNGSLDLACIVLCIVILLHWNKKTLEVKKVASMCCVDV
jgi:hypothetical protein